jgi:hypothetical protein
LQATVIRLGAERVDAKPEMLRRVSKRYNVVIADHLSARLYVCRAPDIGGCLMAMSG